MPDLGGLKVAKADQQLAEVGLKLGKQNPRPNPNRPIVNQVPSAGEKRPTGTAVEVFLKRPKPEPSEPTPEAERRQPCRRRAARQRPRRPRRCRPPACSRGRCSRSTSRRPARSSARCPPPASEAPSDGRVRVVVSAGFPRLAYEGGPELVTADGAEGRAVTAVLPREIVGTKPSWIPDGRAVVARTERRAGHREHQQPGAAHGRLELEPRRRRPRRAVGRRRPDGPRPGLRQPRPRARRSRLLQQPVRNRRRAGRRAGASTAGGSASSPGCRTAARCWPPPSRSTARTGASGSSGCRPTRRSPPTPATGAAARSLRTPAQPRRGVAAVAVDPSGRRLALVSSHATSRFQIALTTPDDLALENAKVLPLQGCDVEWRPDGAELAVVQSDNGCRNIRSRIVRVAPASPRELTTVVLRGRDPAWQPIELGPISPARAPAPGTRP